MEHLLAPQGLHALHQAVCNKPLLGLAFDGTIAPIAAHPLDAEVPAETSQRLARLSKLLIIAIVTGRDVADASARIGFSPAAVIGNHGAEGWDCPQTPDPLDAVRKQLHLCAPALGELGVEVVNKRLSVALNYRRAADPKIAIEQIFKCLQSERISIRTFSGKHVINIVPASAPDKADALRGLMQSFSRTAAIYVGDDANDEPIFSARLPNVLTVRVGFSEKSAALYFLNDVTEVKTMLDHMIAMLAAPHLPRDNR